ncbi:hypothetical protein AAHH78_42160, partial [Burkholderia pseudomallei]
MDEREPQRIEIIHLDRVDFLRLKAVIVERLVCIRAWRRKIGPPHVNQPDGRQQERARTHHVR